MSQDGSICFYSPSQASSFYMSNFAKSPFEVDGVVYACNESFYQAKKFVHEPWYEQAIASTDSPMKAKLLGTQSTNYRFASKWKINKKDDPRLVFDVVELSRKRGITIRPDWTTVRDDVMRTGLKAKFTQNPELRKKLLSTGSARLIENSPRDSYWGIGADGKGQNRLGCLLMELREELRP